MHFDPAVEVSINEKLSLIVRSAAFNRSLQVVADISVYNGAGFFTDQVKPGIHAERRRLIKVVKEKEEVEAAEIDKALLGLHDILMERLRVQDNAESEKQPAAPEIEILDNAPASLRRPLSIVEGKGYAATWVYLKKTTKQGRDDEGNVITYGKPIVESERVLWIVDEDGKVYGEKGTNRMEELEFQIGLSNVPPVGESKLWSAKGVRRFKDRDKPAACEVFERTVETVDRFIDFDHSLADQRTMCELIGCYILSTWFLDAFNVIGYLWPNGEKGSGKTQLLNIVAELSYLGQMILAGGSYSSLRDLADCGATLCFDEAENIASNLNPDDDKKALLLAGNRRGSTVTFKEISPDGKTWQNRFVSTFCARAFSAINLPNGALEDRTTIIPLIRSIDRYRSNADVLDYGLWPYDRARLIDDLWSLGLAHLRELKAADDYVAKNARLTGRNLEPFRSPLAVARWLGEKGVAGLYERMEQLSVDYQAERRGFDSGDLRVLIVRALVSLGGCDTCDTCDTLLAGISPDNKIKTSDIRDSVLEIAHAEEIFSKTDWITPSKVGKSLQKMRFAKSRIAGSGQNAWLIKFKELDRWKRSLGLTGDLLKQVSQVSQVSQLFDNSNRDSIKTCDTCRKQVSPFEQPENEVSPVTPAAGDVEDF